MRRGPCGGDSTDRGRCRAAGALAEALCPACLALAGVSELPSDLQALTGGETHADQAGGHLPSQAICTYSQQHLDINRLSSCIVREKPVGNVTGRAGRG